MPTRRGDITDKHADDHNRSATQLGRGLEASARRSRVLGGLARLWQPEVRLFAPTGLQLRAWRLGSDSARGGTGGLDGRCGVLPEMPVAGLAAVPVTPGAVEHPPVVQRAVPPPMIDQPTQPPGVPGHVPGWTEFGRMDVRRIPPDARAGSAWPCVQGPPPDQTPPESRAVYARNRGSLWATHHSE